MKHYMNVDTDDISPVYSLYAVVVHHDVMNAAFSGHYVCYVKDTQGKWFKADDSQVCFSFSCSHSWKGCFGIKISFLPNRLLVYHLQNETMIRTGNMK